MAASNKEPSALMSLKFVSLKDTDFFFGNITHEIAKRTDIEEKLNINLSASASLSSKDKSVTFNVEIAYTLDLLSDTDEQLLILKYNSEVLFKIENFDDVFVKKRNGVFTAHKQVSATLLGMSISTIRGVLIEKTANSFLSSFPLPVVDPRAIKSVPGIETAP